MEDRIWNENLGEKELRGKGNMRTWEKNEKKKNENKRKKKPHQTCNIHSEFSERFKSMASGSKEKRKREQEHSEKKKLKI